MGKKKEKPIDADLEGDRKDRRPCHEKAPKRKGKSAGIREFTVRTGAEQHPVTSLQSSISLIQLYNWGVAMGDGNEREDNHI